jgi:hypothetical protein
MPRPHHDRRVALLELAGDGFSKFVACHQIAIPPDLMAARLEGVSEFLGKLTILLRVLDEDARHGINTNMRGSRPTRR